MEYLDAYFFYFSAKIFAVGTHWKCLIEMLPMSTQTNDFIEKSGRYHHIFPDKSFLSSIMAKVSLYIVKL